MDTGSQTDPQWHVRQLLMRQGCSDGGRWDVGRVRQSWQARVLCVGHLSLDQISGQYRSLCWKMTKYFHSICFVGIFRVKWFWKLSWGQ